WSTGIGGTTLGYLTDIYDTPPLNIDPRTDAFSQYAHHTYLEYSFANPVWLPTSSAPTPIARPTRLLTRVDVSSKDLTGTAARQQVRRYYLTYTSVADGSSDGPPSVKSVQLEGDCSQAGLASPPKNNFEVNGYLPEPSSSIACLKWPATTTFS